MTHRVTVVGAGVVGLTCAVRLAEAGLDVAVLARELPLETASAVLGGLWLPAPAADPAARERAAVTHRELTGLAADPAAAERAGVRLVTGTLLARAGTDGPAPGGWSRPDVETLAPSRRADPTPVHAAGWDVTLPLVDMRRYLPYLQRRLEAAGGTLTRLALPRLPDRGLVVDCTGAAARALAPDATVRPVRRQSVLVEDPGLEGWWCEEGAGDEEGLVVLPDGRSVVVGTTAQDGDWSPTPEPADTERLLARAVEAVPRLRGAPVLGVRVGVRPGRLHVRIEAERRARPDAPGHVVVHCYGHGAGGLAQSWGSAEAVQALLRDSQAWSTPIST